MSVKYLIADDHTVLRVGLRALIQTIEGWEVVAEAKDGSEVEPLVDEHQPEIVIMDLSMPCLGGVEAIARLCKSNDHPKILVLSASEDEHMVSDALSAGAKGFVPKSADSNEILFALQALLKGQTYLSPSVCNVVLERQKQGEASSPLLRVLSEREREVLRLIAQGIPNRKIAKSLCISVRTIDSHRANIMRKLQASTNADLVKIALKYGLIS